MTAQGCRASRGSDEVRQQRYPTLQAAALREDRLLPPPSGASASARRRVLTRLLGAGAAEEIPLQDEALSWREDGLARIGLRITEAGLAALEPPRSADEPEIKAPRATKRAGVVALIGREGGAGIGELIEATGWQPHTVRAAITGLRKSGLTVETTRGETGTVYRIGLAPTDTGEA